MPTLRLFLLVFLAISAWLTANAQSPELPLHLFSYDKTVPLAFKDSLIGTQQGVGIHKISYASPVKGRVSGLLFVPSGTGPFAGILLQHGSPGTAMNQTPRGLYLARHGAVVLATNAPFAERGGETIQFTPADSVEQVTYMINLQRAVDLLISRSDVDPNRLGYVGRSYSGAMGALFSGIERRLKTYVLAVADGGFIAHFSSEKGELSDQIPIKGAEQKRWIAAMQPIEPIRYIHRAAPAALFMQSARQDEAVSAFAAEQLQKAAPANKVVKWYDAGHRLNTQSYIDQLAWFHDKLGTTAPGPDDQKGPDFPDTAAPKKIP